MPRKKRLLDNDNALDPRWVSHRSTKRIALHVMRASDIRCNAPRQTRPTAPAVNVIVWLLRTATMLQAPRHLLHPRCKSMKCEAQNARPCSKGRPILCGRRNWQSAFHWFLTMRRNALRILRPTGTLPGVRNSPNAARSMIVSDLYCPSDAPWSQS